MLQYIGDTPIYAVQIYGGEEFQTSHNITKISQKFYETHVLKSYPAPFSQSHSQIVTLKMVYVDRNMYVMEFWLDK